MGDCKFPHIQHIMFLKYDQTDGNDLMIQRQGYQYHQANYQLQPCLFIDLIGFVSQVFLFSAKSRYFFFLVLLFLLAVVELLVQMVNAITFLLYLALYLSALLALLGLCLNQLGILVLNLGLQLVKLCLQVVKL